MLVAGPGEALSARMRMPEPELLLFQLLIKVSRATLVLSVNGVTGYSRQPPSDWVPEQSLPL